MRAMSVGQDATQETIGQPLRVLFFAPRQCWPTDTGAKLRNFHLARELARHAELTYLGFREPRTAAEGEGAESPFARTVLVDGAGGYSPLTLARGLVGRVPANVLIYTTQAMSDALSRLLRETYFDIVHVVSVHLAEYLPIIAAAPGKPVVWFDWHNIESELMERYGDRAANPLVRAYARHTASGLRRLEEKVLASCAAVSVPSAREQEALRARYPQACPIHVVENGVDVARFSGDGQRAVPLGARRNLVFVGSMDYHANADAVIWFANEIWPLVSAAHPELSFQIVGRKPGREVEALAARPGIVVTGRVDEVRPYYENALASVVPLRVGGGTRLKILEAMAAGVPVVSTRIGAEGLSAEIGRDYLAAETAQDFVAAVGRLRVSEAWTALERAGRTLVESEYDWPAIGSVLFAAEKALAQSREATRPL